MENGRLLVVFAHPDDESFGLGALIGRYVNESVDVYLICATDGDAGTIPPKMLDGYGSKAELRLAELACASEKLGLKQVIRLGYKDSGMMHTEDNNDPACLWYAWQNTPQDVTRQVVEHIRAIKPQVVITFDRYGGYGHPDHIAIQQAATEAFSLAGDAHYVTDGQQPYQPQKLYYHSIPTAMIRIAVIVSRLLGKDPSRFGTNHDIDLTAILDHRGPTHARVNIRDYLHIGDAASACHASQGGDQTRRIPLFIRKWLTPTQSFERVYPAPKRNIIDEHDLFAGVTLENTVPDAVS